MLASCVVVSREQSVPVLKRASSLAFVTQLQLVAMVTVQYRHSYTSIPAGNYVSVYLGGYACKSLIHGLPLPSLQVCEYGNYSIHAALRDLRPPGTSCASVDICFSHALIFGFSNSFK